VKLINKSFQLYEVQETCGDNQESDHHEYVFSTDTVQAEVIESLKLIFICPELFHASKLSVNIQKDSTKLSKSLSINIAQ